MFSEGATYFAIFIMAAVTLMTRISGTEILRRIGTSARIERFLDALSTSVLAAMVATFVAQGGLRETVAIAVAGIVMLLVRNSTMAMLTGMAIAALWKVL